MTDPIRIPIHAPRIDAHGDRYEVIDSYATITTDLARQIVALGHDEQTRFMLKQTGQLVAAAQPQPGCLNIIGPDGQSHPAGSPEAIKVIDDMLPQPVADDARLLPVPEAEADFQKHLADWQGKPVADDAAEYRRLCAACWRALGVSTYDGRSIPEHIESLRAELAAEREKAKVLKELLLDCKPALVDAHHTLNNTKCDEPEWAQGSIDMIEPLFDRIDAALGKENP